MASILKWLHLSDFHVGKDEYGNIELFDSLLEYIDDHNKIPDIIFITGDISNKANEQEYSTFLDSFIYPLSDKINSTTKIYTVPGNHDINQEKVKSAVQYKILETVPEFFDPIEKGVQQRESIFPRFEAFENALFQELTSVQHNWLRSTEGSFVDIIDCYDKSIGILCINTAWLSMGSNDRHHLSPGLNIIKHGLKKIKNCAHKIVLGHHPLDWLDEDGLAIRALFGKNNVMYLHGHLHKNSYQPEYGAGQPFISIQSGAAFQARESERWINRILCCELNLDTGNLTAQPLQWSKGNQEWSLDGSAFPDTLRKKGTDYWVLNSHLKVKKKIEKSSNDIEYIPEGWLLINDIFLNSRRKSLSKNDLVNFFNGRVPIWREALSPDIPKRTVVKEIVKEIVDSHTANKNSVFHITGAGGEGKTTVLLQTVCELVETKTDWRVLWINDTDNVHPWPHRFLREKINDKEKLLIVSDNSDLISKKIFETVKNLYSDGKFGIQFLLCCRDTDWISSKSSELNWHSYCGFIEKRLRGLSISDCEILIKAWGKCGDKGLGKLLGIEFQDAVKKLHSASISQEKEYVGEGAFLGAMLQVRMGDYLKYHIESLLNKLNQISALNNNLLDAFVYIAAMHSEGLSFLSKEVLAEILQCNLNKIKKKVTGPLGDEAAVSIGGNQIYTRHKSIANTAVEILSNKYHIDFDSIFIDLVESATHAANKGVFIKDLENWRFLSDHFFERNVSLAIRLDKAILSIDPSNPYQIVHLSKLYRKSGNAELGVEVFRNISFSIELRGYYHEWATAEGYIDNHSVAVALDAVSLSDQVEKGFPNNKQAGLSLNGMGIAFYNLYDKFNNHAFIKVCSAIIVLSSQLRLDSRSKRYFNDLKSKTNAEEISSYSVDESFSIFIETIKIAWRQVEIELPPWVNDPDSLTFENLSILLNI